MGGDPGKLFARNLSKGPVRRQAVDKFFGCHANGPSGSSGRAVPDPPALAPVAENSYGFPEHPAGSTNSRCAPVGSVLSLLSPGDPMSSDGVLPVVIPPFVPGDRSACLFRSSSPLVASSGFVAVPYRSTCPRGHHRSGTARRGNDGMYTASPYGSLCDAEESGVNHPGRSYGSVAMCRT